MKPTSFLNPGTAQAFVGGMALLLLAAAPAPGKAQLLVSLRGDDAAMLANWASRADARILGPGPTTNSLIVRAEHAIGWKALRHGAILLAGPAGGCGDE